VFATIFYGIEEYLTLPELKLESFFCHLESNNALIARSASFDQSMREIRVGNPANSTGMRAKIPSRYKVVFQIGFCFLCSWRPI